MKINFLMVFTIKALRVLRRNLMKFNSVFDIN